MSRRPNEKAREHITQIAFNLFYENGFKGVSMDDVARGAGIKKANLFHYYPTKEDLGLAALSYGTSCQKAGVEKRFSNGSDPIKVVEGMFTDAALSMKKNKCCRGCFMGNLAQEISDHNEKLRSKISDYFRFWVDRLTAFLEHWRVQGYFKKDLNPEESAEAIISLFEGAMLCSKATKETTALENARKMAKAYLGGLKA